MTRCFPTEAELVDAAAAFARRWRAAGVDTLRIALYGDLGAGKTTWVRAMLRGLGHAGRVPSPTYTLIESYPLDGLTIVHVDLYRLADADELEYLGLRDWLAEPGVWLLVEWPDRVPALVERADLTIRLVPEGETGRRVELDAGSETGRACLAALDQAGA